MSARKRRQRRDLRHKGTRKGMAFGQQQGVGSLFIGTPHGLRKRDSGRHHKQRMRQWEDGQDMASRSSTAKCARLERFTGPERGTSSRCPACGWQQKVPGRLWRCRNPHCSLCGQRDVVGSVTMHPLAFGHTMDVPAEAHVSTARPLMGPSPE